MSQEPEDEVDNIIPMKVEMESVFRFVDSLENKSSKLAEGDKGDFYIEIGTWVHGDPIVKATITGIKTKEVGMGILRDIGHSWKYDISYVAHLLDSSGKRVGQLNIYQNSWGVVDLETTTVVK